MVHQIKKAVVASSPGFILSAQQEVTTVIDNPSRLTNQHFYWDEWKKRRRPVLLGNSTRVLTQRRPMKKKERFLGNRQEFLWFLEVSVL